MAVEVTAVSAGRKQMAAASLRSKVDEIVAARKLQHEAAGVPARSGRQSDAVEVESAQRRPSSGAHAAVPRALKTSVSSAAGAATLHLVRGPAIPRPAPGAPPALAARPASKAGVAAGRQSASMRPAARPAGAPAMRGTFYGSKQPPSALLRPPRSRLDEYDDDEDDDEFLEDDEDGGDWRAELREALGGYDPSKFADIDRMDDRTMEVTRYSDIAQEESRSLRIARDVDRREAEAEALRIARKMEVRKRKRGAAAFLDDD